ncbi:MAG: hydrogenase maturation nickel metallochaperone HypA [Saprospiraceae bacterium]|jgi:hydrogenase nickel incorporation protein HypA/HybF|nr:hydrogenase maturation nickel metallochaperone HypA [Saprospiraceae bacterium]MBL0101201.1 hydrogenase maturation nickel metallochaperone HypA [Saprospiraceae bacterium]
MHELSIVMSIIEIANTEAVKANVSKIDAIELEIGLLSGIEMSAFDFAWQEAVKSTVLENAERNIIKPEGKAHCLDCNSSFDIDNLYEQCPVCKSHFIDITQGKELRVKSVTVQ